MDGIEMTNLPAKQEYEAPAVSVIGTFEQITQATHHGEAIDGVYPIHTPFSGHQS